MLGSKFYLHRKYPFRNFPGFFADIYYIYPPGIRDYGPVMFSIVSEKDNKLIGTASCKLDGKNPFNSDLSLLTIEDWEAIQR